MYIYTGQDKMDRIAGEIWQASKQEDHEKFSKCLIALKALRLTAENRVEYAKAALAALKMDVGDPERIATVAFSIADAMLAEEAKPR